MKSEKEHCCYYIYHDEGYYGRIGGNNRGQDYLIVLKMDTEGERFDMVDDFGKFSLQECIDSFNKCRAESCPKRLPIKVKKVIKWSGVRLPELVKYENECK